MERRNTIQRDVVLKAVKSLGCHPTAEEVYAEVAASYPRIGRGTVYRNLGILSEEGQIQKIVIPGGADCYDHTLAEHYHVQCIQCSRTYDVDMDVIPNLKDRIKDSRGFEFIDYSIIFKGICPGCRA